MKLQLCQSVHRGYCMTPGDCLIKINFPAHIYFMCNLLRIIYMTTLVRVVEPLMDLYIYICKCIFECCKYTWTDNLIIHIAKEWA